VHTDPSTRNVFETLHSEWYCILSREQNRIDADNNFHITIICVHFQLGKGRANNEQRSILVTLDQLSIMELSVFIL
jgi:hypothetical protein